MRFISIRERSVFEMVFETESGRTVAVEIDEATRNRFWQAINEHKQQVVTSPLTTYDQPLEVKYDEGDEILEDMNERLASLGLPTVVDEEADGVDQV